MAFVLDCSVTMAWHFKDEWSPHCDRVLDRILAGEQALVPGIWRLEVVNTLLVGIKRSRTTYPLAIGFLDDLEDLGISVEGFGEWANYRAIASLAHQHTLTSYDASYLQLAILRSCPIACIDNKLTLVARSLGLEYTP